jgi:uncharacterized protein (DUF433 family)
MQMTTTPVTSSHIVLDERGRPWVAGTNTKVIEIAMDRMMGLSPDQIHEEHPHLPLAKVYAALSYYYDHQQEIDTEIARQAREFEEARAAAIAAGTQLTREQLEQRAREKGLVR